MKRIVVLCALLVCALPASGQQTTTYDTGIGHATPMVSTEQSKLPNALVPVVITSDYYAGPKVLVLHALNNSGKDITGYTMIIRHKNADGTVDKGGWSETTSDMLNVLINRQLAKDSASDSVRMQNAANDSFPPGTGIFVTGETRDMTLTAGFNSGSELDIIAGVVLTELTKRRVEAMGKPRRLGLVPMDEDGGLQSLQRLGYGEQKNKTERERLAQYLAEQEKRVELMTPHCHLEIALKE